MLYARRMDGGNRMFEAYAVKDKGTPEMQRTFLGFSDSLDRAKWDVRDAIAWGFEYGYVKEHGQTVGYYTEESFKLRKV